MSAEFQAGPPVDLSVTSSTVLLNELTSRRKQASNARRHAAAIGDYVAAERWYRQERSLDAQLAACERGRRQSRT